MYPGKKKDRIEIEQNVKLKYSSYPIENQI